MLKSLLKRKHFERKKIMQLLLAERLHGCSDPCVGKNGQDTGKPFWTYRLFLGEDSSIGEALPCWCAPLPEAAVKILCGVWRAGAR